MKLHIDEIKITAEIAESIRCFGCEPQMKKISEQADLIMEAEGACIQNMREVEAAAKIHYKSVLQAIAAMSGKETTEEEKKLTKEAKRMGYKNLIALMTDQAAIVRRAQEATTELVVELATAARLHEKSIEQLLNVFSEK